MPSHIVTTAATMTSAIINERFIRQSDQARETVRANWST
jgi:hypothetical protein